MGTGDILLGGKPPVQGGAAILLGLLHATETGIQPCGPLPTYPLLQHSLGGVGEVGVGSKPLILLYTIFHKKGTPFVNLLLINGTLFTYLVQTFASLLTAVIALSIK